MVKALFYVKFVTAVFLCYGLIYFYLSFHRLTGTIDQGDVSKTKLQLDVYMETRCPDTEIFVADQLLPVVQSLGDYISVTLYPYGKAEETFDGEKWIFSCQHGPSECQGNTILGCAISMTNQSTFVPLTACLMINLDPISNYKQCFQKFNLNTPAIETCSQGATGNRIQHENALATSRLTPKLKFIPWIIINKVYSDANQERSLTNLKGLVCDYLKTHPQCK